jgi:hypothetical protein
MIDNFRGRKGSKIDKTDKTNSVSQQLLNHFAQPAFG